MRDVIFAMRTFWVLAVPYFRSDDRWPGRALLAGVIAAELGLVIVSVEVAAGMRAFSTRSSSEAGT